MADFGNDVICDVITLKIMPLRQKTVFRTQQMQFATLKLVLAISHDGGGPVKKI